MMVSRLRWLNRLTLSLQVASTDSKVTINRHLNCPARRTVQQDETKNIPRKNENKEKDDKRNSNNLSLFFLGFFGFSNRLNGAPSTGQNSENNTNQEREIQSNKEEKGGKWC